MTKKKEPGIEEITLRDFFAAFAMQGLIATPKKSVEGDLTDVYYAETAYIIANAMLEARKK